MTLERALVDDLAALREHAEQAQIYANAAELERFDGERRAELHVRAVQHADHAAHHAARAAWRLRGSKETP